MSQISYRIYPLQPEAHLFQVDLLIASPDPQGQHLRLPAWIPGSYMVRDFARNVVRLNAVSDGRELAVERVDKSVWLCEPCAGELRVRYEVYAWDLSVRAAHLDTTHGFFNGTSVFLEVVGQAEQPCVVEILPPEGEVYRNWRVATTLPLAGAELYGFGAYRAADYDELIDHPVEMGDFTLATFEACGVPHDIVLTGRHDADMARLCADLKKICEHHIRFFGEPAPVERYVFMTMVTGDGYGGLEHRASTALMTARSSLPGKGEKAISKGYREFLGLCSHEYFHTWNVKRIKPEVFVPYELSKETYTRLLWAFEGITSYYDDLALVRCGLIKPESYLELLAQTISRVWRGRGRYKQTVTDSSFDAWTKFYKQDENAPNAIVSYYTKGALIALCLDVFVQQQSDGEFSLDHIMRELWQRYGQRGVGVPEDGVEALVREFVGEAASGFFDSVLRSTEELPLEASLSWLGVDLELRAARNQNDWGGVTRAVSRARSPKGDLAVRCRDERGFALITHVYEGGTAQRAGLAAGDLLVAVNGLQVSGAKLEECIARLPVGSEVNLTAFRRDELLQLREELQAAELHTVWLRLSDGGEERRQTWLGLI